MSDSRARRTDSHGHHPAVVRMVAGRHHTSTGLTRAEKIREAVEIINEADFSDEVRAAFLEVVGTRWAG